MGLLRKQKRVFRRYSVSDKVPDPKCNGPAIILLCGLKRLSFSKFQRKAIHLSPPGPEAQDRTNSSVLPADSALPFRDPRDRIHSGTHTLYSQRRK